MNLIWLNQEQLSDLPHKKIWFLFSFLTDISNDIAWMAQMSSDIIKTQRSFSHNKHVLAVVNLLLSVDCPFLSSFNIRWEFCFYNFYTGYWTSRGIWRPLQLNALNSTHWRPLVWVSCHLYLLFCLFWLSFQLSLGLARDQC